MKLIMCPLTCRSSVQRLGILPRKFQDMSRRFYGRAEVRKIGQLKNNIANELKIIIRSSRALYLTPSADSRHWKTFVQKLVHTNVTSFFSSFSKITPLRLPSVKKGLTMWLQRIPAQTLTFRGVRECVFITKWNFTTLQ